MSNPYIWLALLIAAGVIAFYIRKSGSDAAKLKQEKANVKVAEKIAKAGSNDPGPDDISKRLSDGSWKL